MLRVTYQVAALCKHEMRPRGPGDVRHQRHYAPRHLHPYSAACVDVGIAVEASVFHAVGGIIVTGATNDFVYREILAGESDEFRLVRDLAKATKHLVVDRGKPLSTADQTVCKGLGWGEARRGE